MKINITSLTDSTIKFTLSESSIAFANSLRRTLLSDIPVLAIERVEIIKNFSVVPDEMLAHRLGLVPIHSKKMLRKKEECDCATGCKECTIEGFLRVANESGDILCVTSNDFVFKGEGVRIEKSGSPALIAKLSNRQSIGLNFFITRGTAAKHAKYSAVSVVNYEYDPTNVTRHTEFWHENDVEMEWPGLRQDEPDLTVPVTEIEMGFEVVEGVLEPLEVLKRGLEILHNKVVMLKENVCFK